MASNNSPHSRQRELPCRPPNKAKPTGPAPKLTQPLDVPRPHHAGHHHPQRPAVVGRQRGAVHLICQQHVAAGVEGLRGVGACAVRVLCVCELRVFVGEGVWAEVRF
jgi:hypothetical protein